MSIVRCPRCRDEVTVPLKAGSRALVRCPLCLEEYLLSEALANAPPPLVIIGGEVEQAALPSNDEMHEYQLAGPAPAAIAEPVTASVARSLPRTAIRPRRKESSGVALVGSYVGGGVLGLALGLLVLWWLIGKDPLNAGPAVADYAPWIVPARFHGKVESPEPEPARSSVTISRDGGESSKPRRKRAAPAERTLTPSTDLQTLPTLDDPASPTSLIPAVESPPLESLEQPTTDVPKSKGSKTKGVDQAGHTTDSSSAHSPPSAPPPAPDLTGLLPDDWPATVPESQRKRSMISPDEVNEAVATCVAARLRYEETPANNADARAESLGDFHGALGEVGRLLSYRLPGDEELAASIDRFDGQLKEIATKPGLLTGLELLGADRLPDLPDGYGLVAIGTVKSIDQAGSLLALTLQSQGKASPIEWRAATPTDPRDLCEVGDVVVVAGRLVSEPQKNLPGYEGQDARIVVAGYLFAVPK